MEKVTQLTFPSFSCAVHQETKNGNTCSGDSYFVDERHGDYFVVAIADGLGSGTAAQFASQKATALMKELHHLPVTQLVTEINEHLLGTRGIVLAVAKFFPQQKRAEFIGIGNIGFTLYPLAGKRIRTLSLPGYLDGRHVRLRQEHFVYSPGDTVVMYSDGIVPRAEWGDVFRAAKTPIEGLHAIRHKWVKQNDDLTVLVGC